MKLNEMTINLKDNAKGVAEDVMKALIKHFQYSIKDIESWDELTPEEKKIIDKETFNLMTHKFENMGVVKVECPHCHMIHPIPVEVEDFKKWDEQGVNIQRAFPYLSAKWREMMITRTCPKCWKKIMKRKGN